MDIIDINTSLYESRGCFNRQRTGVIGTSTANKYYPIMNTVNPQILSENPKIYYYYRYYVVGVSNYAKTYDDLQYMLRGASGFGRYSFKRSGEDLYDEFKVHRGYMADTNHNILLCMCTTEMFLKDTFDEGAQKLDAKKFKLFVSTEFVNNPAYSNVWKTINRDYVTVALDMGIRVEYLTSDEILSEVYQNEFDIKFNTVTELIQHLKTEVSSILFMFNPLEDDEDEDYEDNEELEDDFEDDDDEITVDGGPATTATHIYTGTNDDVGVFDVATNPNNPVVTSEWVVTSNSGSTSFVVGSDPISIGSSGSSDRYTISTPEYSESHSEDDGVVYDEGVGTPEPEEIEIDDQYTRADEVANVDITLESPSSILTTDDIREFLLTLEGPLPIRIVYTDVGEIIALYDGHTTEYTEEDILSAISEEAPGVPITDEPIGVNEIFESMSLVSRSGISYTYENRCEGFIDVDTLNVFVDAIMLFVNVTTASLVYDVDIDVQDTEGNQHLFSETDVYNMVARYNSSVTTVNEINLIDDTDGQ